MRHLDVAQTGELAVPSRPRLDVLILHDNHDLSQVRRTSFNHSFCLLKYAPWNNYYLQSFRDPIPPSLRHRRFDVVMLDTTFLCWRWTYPRKDNFERLLREYAFIADSDAVKIALPQDEYDHAALLDQWLTDWRVDVIYSVCYEHRDLLYPKASVRAEIVESMTGYVDDADVAMMSRYARPFDEREIDVGYRAKSLPPYFGRFGRLKAEIGERFRAAYAATGLRLDISVDSRDTFLGDEWLRFLGNCRFTLGCESGSSLLDPVGEINRACKAYLAKRPRADFAEVEAACFPGEDMRRVYSAISPRIFEAALAGTCQILVPGRYMGILRPDEHYIPWQMDGPDSAALHPELTDWRRARERVAACRAALLRNDQLTYRGFVRALLDRTEARLESRGRSLPCRVRAIEPSPGAVEALHTAAEAAVRAGATRGGDKRELREPGAPAAAELDAAEERAPAPGVPRICLLALSAIVDDPRVRRQGELFSATGWDVTAVGIPGGRSAPPAWRILSAATTQVVSIPAAEPVPPAAATHRRFIYWRRGVSGVLARRPRLWRSAFLAWRGFRYCALLPLRTYWAIRENLQKLATAARRAARSVAVRTAASRNLRGFLARTISQACRGWRDIKQGRRVLRVRIQPDLAEEFFWNDLAISAQLRALYERAARINADVWLANDWTMLPLAARLAREKGGIYVYDTHEFATEEFAEEPKWRRWKRPIVYAIERRFIGGAAVVSAVSAGIAEGLDALYDLPRASLVIRNMPVFEEILFRPTATDRIRVLYHGIVAPNRGLEAAIDSVPGWRGEFELTIRGPGEAGYLKQLGDRIERQGVADRARLVPPVAMTALVREAAQFDIGFFALPGHSQHNQFALPNKFFEYVMAGLMLCVSDLPEMARLIRQYDLGVTVPAVEPGAIAAAINALAPGRIDHFKRRALAAARELCWDREATRLLDAYGAVLHPAACGG